MLAWKPSGLEVSRAKWYFGETRSLLWSRRFAMKRFHLSLARTMAIVAVLAVDCALLSTFSTGSTFYPEMLLFVPVLQVGLFRMVPRQGRVKPYWVGFELFGWAAVLAWYLGLSEPMGWCFQYGLTHLTAYLAKHHTGLFHLLRPLV